MTSVSHNWLFDILYASNCVPRPACNVGIILSHALSLEEIVDYSMMLQSLKDLDMTRYILQGYMSYTDRHIQPRGHSITTWTKFYPILATPPSSGQLLTFYIYDQAWTFQQIHDRTFFSRSAQSNAQFLKVYRMSHRY